MSGSRGGILLGMVGGVLLAAAIAMANAGPTPPSIELSLSTAELDSLGTYLSPSSPAPVLDEYGAFLPARAPDRTPVATPDVPAAEPDERRDWTLSAIVTGGTRPLAIIDDVTFAPGAMLPDGSRLVEIEPGHVVLREPNGTRRTLRLKAG